VIVTERNTSPLLAPLTIGTAVMPSRFFLAPLAGYTSLGLRLAVRELGGLGLATTDLINPIALLRGNRQTQELLRTCPADRPLAVQIYGTEPGSLRDAAQWLQGYGVTAVDLNMGCPVHKVTRHGGGSALLCDLAKTVALVRTVVEAVTIPVTVKMRLGWDADSLSAPRFAREFEQVGVAAVTIHGRTRAQGFGGSVNLDGIRAVVDAVERLPVVGNGDIRSIADAERMLSITGCAAVAIGRGALLNPWIFTQLQRWFRTGDPGQPATREQRLIFMERHFRLLTADRGEHFGCLLFRKVANWYCRVLRPGHALQQRMVRIGSVLEFNDILAEIRAQRRGDGVAEELFEEPCIPVPRGPVERW
jgi:nifR3 family TIM-barrel protein